MVFDIGTNNEALLNDPFYFGIQQHRVRGNAYDELFEELIKAVQEVSHKHFSSLRILRMLMPFAC